MKDHDAKFVFRLGSDEPVDVELVWARLSAAFPEYELHDFGGELPPSDAFGRPRRG